jgi:hypothetical protein
MKDLESKIPLLSLSIPDIGCFFIHPE